MASAIHIQSTSVEAPTPVDTLRPGDIVSRCGLLCNTCSAYLTGACPGCPSLETGDCVIRDCADLKGTNCLDCEATSCYHFESYTWRRRSMNAVAKHDVRITSPDGKASTGGGCSTGGCCGTAGGGCGGCTLMESEGCPAARFAETLEAI